MTGVFPINATLKEQSNLYSLGYLPLPIHTSDNAPQAGGRFELAVILILNDNYDLILP
jgi:hypothetical protein